MIGQLQWALPLGRYDILAHVMSISRFRLAPKIAHLERLERLYGYLLKTKLFVISDRTKEPNYSHLPIQKHDWSRTVYGNVKEEIPKEIPKPLGTRVKTATFIDTNLLHKSQENQSQQCYTSSISLLNGSELIAARTATEQIMDYKYTWVSRCSHHDQGILVWCHSLVCTQQTHNMLSYHRVREAIVANIHDFY